MTKVLILTYCLLTSILYSQSSNKTLEYSYYETVRDTTLNVQITPGKDVLNENYSYDNKLLGSDSIYKLSSYNNIRLGRNIRFSSYQLIMMFGNKSIPYFDIENKNTNNEKHEHFSDQVNHYLGIKESEVTNRNVHNFIVRIDGKRKFIIFKSKPLLIEYEFDPHLGFVRETYSIGKRVLIDLRLSSIDNKPIKNIVNENIKILDLKETWEI